MIRTGRRRVKSEGMMGAIGIPDPPHRNLFILNDQSNDQG
jgi:hypothetical protein